VIENQTGTKSLDADVFTDIVIFVSSGIRISDALRASMTIMLVSASGSERQNIRMLWRIDGRRLL
jgi:hypothetical protein